MATTTAQITLSSTDLTTDALSLTTTATLTDTGSKVGVTETSGLSRKITTSVSEYTLLAEADYADDKAHKIYLKHVGTTASDIKLTPNVSTSVTVEYMVIVAS